MKPALLLRLSVTLPTLLIAAPGQSQPAPAEMLQVPGGTFTMGADGVGESDEQPAHAVTVKGFWLDRTEVTNARYLDCVQAGKCSPFRDDVARRFRASSGASFSDDQLPSV